MEIKDLVGLSKPLTRLIEVISDGIGAVSRPYLIRRNADAKAHEVRVISSAHFPRNRQIVNEFSLKLANEIIGPRYYDLVTVKCK